MVEPSVPTPGWRMSRYLLRERSISSILVIQRTGDQRSLWKIFDTAILRMFPADFLLILNRQDTITPAVAKLNREQIAGYFMLGETKGTSAGGKAESGKNLRVPGTNPFFFDDDSMQANRLMELLETMPNLQAYVMSTGRVGGGEDVEGSKKIGIPQSSAIVQGIVEGTIEWVDDPEFGYQVAVSVPGIEDPELLQPSKLYDRLGRRAEYSSLVKKLKEERSDYLASYPALDPSIPEGVLPLELR